MPTLERASRNASRFATAWVSFVGAQMAMRMTVSVMLSAGSIRAVMFAAWWAGTSMGMVSRLCMTSWPLFCAQSSAMRLLVGT